MDTEAEDTQNPTSDTAPDLIDLQDPVLSPAGPSCDVTSPATAEEFIVLDESEDQSYISCFQVSTKKNLRPATAEPDDHVTRDGCFHRAAYSTPLTLRTTRRLSSNLSTHRHTRPTYRRRGL